MRGLRPWEDLRALLFIFKEDETTMSKPFLTYDDQIKKLTADKQMKITDPAYAKTILKDIGYFSLIGGYKTPFIDPMTRVYQNDTSFEDTHPFPKCLRP